MKIGSAVVATPACALREKIRGAHFLLSLQRLFERFWVVVELPPFQGVSPFIVSEGLLIVPHILQSLTYREAQVIAIFNRNSRFRLLDPHL